jgi:NAD+ synthetase
MICLYDLAHQHDGIVLSTDNLTELLLGFWTLHGDVGDLGMIQSLFKTEVYGLASYLARKFEVDYMDAGAAKVIRRCIAAVPTDGLGVTNSDLDQLLPGWYKKDADSIVGYRKIDKALMDYLNEGIGDTSDPVIERHLKSEFKRNNPLNIPRTDLLKED